MNRDLFLASEAGDVAAIQRLVHGRNTQDVQSVTIPVDSALDIAVTRGHPNPSNLDDASESGDVLLGRTFQGDTPLHVAARKGHLQLVQWILAEKPSLAKVRNKDGNTPLHEAAKCGSTYVVEEFLKANQSFNDSLSDELGDFLIKPYLDSGGETPSTNYGDFIEDYLDSGGILPAESYFRRKMGLNKFGETPLVIASQYGLMEIVKLLLHPPLSQYVATQFEVRRCLKEAAQRGYTDVFVALLDDTPTHILDGILHTAVQGGHPEILKAMLDHFSWENDSMMERDEYGRCAIHVAAMKGHWDIINEFMLRMPDSVQIRSSDEKSVLHFAVEYDQLDVVKCLLAKIEADEAVKMVSRDHDRSRNTAFHFAAKNEANIQILEILLRFRGDNINALNREGMTALDIASAAAQPNANCAIITEKLEGA